MVDAATAPIWFNILVYIQLYFKTYWYILYPALIGVAPFVLVRTFSIPLLTRNPAELVLIFGPRKVTVLKVTSHYLPFFVHKQRLYWFTEPLPMGNNLVHIYFEAVNQDVVHLDRLPDKEANILSLREYFKQVSPQHVNIPPSMKTFNKNWVLIVNEPEGKVELKTAREAGLKGKQYYQIGILKRIGLYHIVAQEVESTTASSTAKPQLITLTVQSVFEKLGDIVKGNNFSSRMAYKIIKRARYLEINWVRLLLGDFDWRLILVILLVIAAIAGIYFLFPQGDLSSLGPPPAGIK